MENEFLTALRQIATHPAARGLADDAALLDGLVITHDMLVEGVHFLGSDPPEDVAWKLVAVNLSDLAAKGAKPVAVLMGAGLHAQHDWNAAFAGGLGRACRAFDVALIGGDTVKMPDPGPKAFGLTAIGKAGEKTPARSGAKPGDRLIIAGNIGDAGLGLEMARGSAPIIPQLLNAYRRPTPLLALGQALASHVSAMMDVSDGLLIDAQRIAEASQVKITLHLEKIVISSSAQSLLGDGLEGRLRAATFGDDYALLAATSAIPQSLTESLTEIGAVSAGTGIELRWHGTAVPLPDKLGWLHG